MKNKVYYIIIELSGVIFRILAPIVYFIVFPLRHKTLKFMTKRVEEDKVYRIFKLKHGYKKWKVSLHPYCWLFWFTTGLTDNYSGHYWFLRKKKEKWFPWLMEPYDKLKEEANKFLDVAYPLRDKWYQKLRYFYICYRWQALRNSHWAFNEWFFREGKWKADSERMEYCDPPLGSIYKYWDIAPQLKWDDGNDGGRVLRFQTEDTPVDEIWLCTHLGKKKITFTTFKGNRRFLYAYCKIIHLRRLKLLIEHQFGWNWWNGIPEFHFKHILRKN